MKNIQLANLPALGAELDGGIYAGLTTRPDGTNCAVVLLPGVGEKLTWSKAKAWAKKQKGELPTRGLAALLFSNVKSELIEAGHWTADEVQEDDGDYPFAFHCYFNECFIDHGPQDFKHHAVAVRLIPLIA